MHFKVRTDMVYSLCLSFLECENPLVPEFGGAGGQVTGSALQSTVCRWLGRWGGQISTICPRQETAIKRLQLRLLKPESDVWDVVLAHVRKVSPRCEDCKPAASSPLPLP